MAEQAAPAEHGVCPPPLARRGGGSSAEPFVPFFLSGSIFASLLWPVRPLKEGEEACRDYVEGINDPLERLSRLSAFFETPRGPFEVCE